MFRIWIVIELNLLRFIYLIFFDLNLNKNYLIMYILIQNLNSYIFLFSIINIIYSNMYILFYFLINLRILSKLGLFPFFLWYLKTEKYISLINIKSVNGKVGKNTLNEEGI